MPLGLIVPRFSPIPLVFSGSYHWQHPKRFTINTKLARDQAADMANAIYRPSCFPIADMLRATSPRRLKLRAEPPNCCPQPSATTMLILSHCWFRLPTSAVTLRTAALSPEPKLKSPAASESTSPGVLKSMGRAVSTT